jgi:hypothetical protein
MPVAVTWKVVELTHATSDGGVTRVVWRCIAANDSGPEFEYTPDVYECTYDASSPSFVPYDDLTENIVLGWVWADMGDARKAEIETNLVTVVDAEIAKNAADPTTTPPWVVPEEEPEPVVHEN